MLSFALSILRLFKAILRAWRQPTFRGTLFVALTILLSGTLFYHGTEGWGWIDSFYFSVMTIATVGAADLVPQTPMGRLFTALYVIAGVGVFVALFSQLGQALTQEDKADSRKADPRA